MSDLRKHIKRNLSLLLVLGFVIMVQCKDDEHDPDQDFFPATVLSEDTNCESVYDIHLTEWAHGFSDSTEDNNFKAIQLPEHLQDTGIKIRVRMRYPNSNEVLTCDTSGPDYRQVVIEEAFRD